MEKHLIQFTGPAIYCIKVQGFIDQRFAGCFGDMIISTEKKEEGDITSKLKGKLKDQSELMGIMNSLYSMHLPIVSIQTLDN